jgi:hypothetical protein
MATRMMLVMQMHRRKGTVGSSSAIFIASLLHAHTQLISIHTKSKYIMLPVQALGGYKL